MKNNLITVASYRDKDNNLHYIIEDMEHDTSYIMNFGHNDFTFLNDTNGLNEIICELMEAIEIDYINQDYIEALKNEIFEASWNEKEKIELFNLLSTFKEWEV